MSPLTGMVPGTTMAERAVAIAGCMAELGVAVLCLEENSRRTELSTRVTDLPRLLCEAVAQSGLAKLHAPALDVFVHLTHDHAAWTTCNLEVAQSLRSSLSAT